MRLTLRTLLAWLDDTLPTSEVRQIGQQVNESPVARELVERIHRVTRQRRLTVPSTSGPDGMDPNTVAEYLDNLLPPDAVADFEKVCLKSDVHLAETASVHQILSLLGQRAKVPPEARNRMYRLIRSGEAGRATSARMATPTQPEPTAALPPWSQPEPPQASWIERFGPALAVLGLVILLSWSTYVSLAPEERPAATELAKQPDAIAKAKKAEKHPGPIAKAKAVEPAPAPPQVAQAVPKPSLLGESDGVEADADAEPDSGALALANDQGQPDLAGEPKAPEKTEPAAVPPSAIGTLVEGESPGVLLRRDGENQPWQRVSESSSLQAGDLLVSLDPFRNTIALKSGRLVLVKGTIVHFNPTVQDALANLELREGQMVLQGTNPPEHLGLTLGEASLEVQPPSGGAVGIERINQLLPGEPATTESWLLISATNGPTELNSSSGSETLQAGESIRFNAKEGFQEKQASPSPSWLTEADPPAVEQEAGRQFARLFSEKTPPLTNLVEASSHDRPEMRRLAIEALGLIDQISLVVEAFNTQGNGQAALVRLAAIASMRSILARGGESAQALHDELVLTGGSDDWADQVTQLLVGIPADRSEAPRQLVKLLESPDVGVRELALQNLMALSHRADALGYDPGAPNEGDGLKHWKELLDRGEILPKATEP